VADLSTIDRQASRARIRMMSAIACYTILIIGGLSMIIPFLWMLSTSLKDASAVFTLPPQWVPEPVVWSNYVTAWKVVPFGRFYLNSIFVTLCVTVGQVFTSSLSAYAFARLRFPGRDRLFFLYLATMMIPSSVTMIPVFILLKMIGWIDSYKALIVPAIFSAYGTFMLRQFFMSLPRDLEDAAKIDGCGFLGIYWRVVLPLSKPALATLTTFTFMAAWGNFMWPLIVINSMDKMTLPVGLSSFQGLYTTDWPLLMAGSVMVMVPLIVLFVFNQRFFTEGIKLSGMHGI